MRVQAVPPAQHHQHVCQDGRGRRRCCRVYYCTYLAVAGWCALGGGSGVTGRLTIVLSPAQCSTRGGRQLQRAGRLSAGDRGIQQGRQVPARPSRHGGGFFVVRPSVHCRCPISSLYTLITVPTSAHFAGRASPPACLGRFHHDPLPRPAVHHLQSPPPLSSHLHFRFRRCRRRLASLITALAPAPPPPPLTALLLHTACPHSPSTTTTIHHQQRSWSFLRSAAQPRTTTQSPPIAHHTATPPHARTHHDDIRRPDRPICA